MPRLYLYGVTRAGVAAPVDVPRVEPADGDVRRVDDGGVAVLASPLSDGRVRTTPANLRAHEEVVEAARRLGVVLPFRFGMLVDSEETLRSEFLAGNEDHLARMLDRFEGLVELRVISRYCGDQALREVARSSDRIRRLQAKVDRRPDAASYYDRIALGEEVVGALARLRERDAERLASRLRAASKAECRLTGDSETTVLRAAYLVEASRLRQFDRALAAIGEQQDGRMELNAVGPLAPWDFVELTRDDLGPRTGPRQRPRRRQKAAA